MESALSSSPAAERCARAPCRATRRIDELMGQLESACKVVGDTDLADKFAASRETIRHGIMFAASLFI